MSTTALRRLALATVAAAVAVILLSTLTPIGNGAGGCALGIPCTLGHALAFFVLGLPLSVLYATSGSARRSPRRTLMMLLLALWIFAAGDELLQAQVGRDAALGDWLADMAGALTGLFGGALILRSLAPLLGLSSTQGAEPERPPPSRRAGRARRRRAGAERTRD